MRNRIKIFGTIGLILCFGCVAFFSEQKYPIRSFAEEVNEIYYADAGTPTTQTETFSYVTKVSTSENVNNTFPAYYNANTSLTNCCGCVAGTNLLGFYDRYYSDLIPNYTPGNLRPNGYYYYTMNYNRQKKQDVIDSLYTLMGTNTTGTGTTKTQYETGLNAYVASKNLTITHSSVMTGSSLDMTKVISAISEGKPISIFLTGFNISTISDTGSSVTLTKNVFSDNHIAIVYGYETVEYYNSTGTLIQTKTYLNIASGKSNYTGVYVVGNNGTVNAAHSDYIS